MAAKSRPNVCSRFCERQELLLHELVTDFFRRGFFNFKMTKLDLESTEAEAKALGAMLSSSGEYFERFKAVLWMSRVYIRSVSCFGGP